MKKTIMLFIVLILAVGIVGCMREKEETVSNVNVATEEQENEEDIEIEAESDALISDEKNYYKCMEEIKNASPEDVLVQIDDMIFQYGSSVSEAIEIIEGSKGNYEFKVDYNENELVAPGDPAQIILLKDSDWYFELGVSNSTDETIQLKDCSVINITAYGASKGNIYYAGFKEDNDGAITYNYVKESMKDYEVFQESSVYDNAGDKFLYVAYSIPFQLTQTGRIYIFFVFESDTGELVAFEIHQTNSVNIPT